MITAGVDVGSLFTKAVVLDDERIAASEVIATTGNAADDIDEMLVRLLEGAGVSLEGLDGIVATGRGGELVRAAEDTEDVVTCVGWATREYLTDVELVVDVGGQSITTVLIDDEGEVVDIHRNDRCASGSGRFLDVMAAAVGVSMDRVDEVAATSASPAAFSSQCGVFVESEVVTHVNAGVRPPDIVAGLCNAVARIVTAQARRLARGKRYTLAGGVARVDAVVDRISERLDGQYQPIPIDPQLTAAIGAALLASPE